jgi:hypothetical protein
MKTSTTSACLVILLTVTSLANSCSAFRFPDPEEEYFSRHPKLKNAYAANDTTPETSNLVEDTSEVGVIKPFCNGTDYCSDAPNYPSKQILQMMAKTKRQFASMFDEPVIGFHISARTSLNSFDVEEDENVCGMFHEDITPRVAKNSKGAFKFVVNSPENNQKYIQRVQTGQCYNPGEDCFSGGFVPQTYCKQQFLEHKLLALSDDLTEIVVDTFPFPSCCTCHVKFSEL